jgi:hypothetical protein
MTQGRTEVSKLVDLAALMIFCGGSLTEASDAADLPSRQRPSYVRVICPRIQAYSGPFEARLAQQLAEIDEGSPISIALADYMKLRDALRECKLDPD